MAKAATIREIASQAGVSTATVSRVLNNSTNVDEGTRNRVLEVIQRNHYSPSSAARTLSNQRSSAIGVIIPEINNSYFCKILEAVANLADESRYTLVCYCTKNKSRKDIQSLEMLRNNRVRGLIYAPSFDSSQPENLSLISQALDDLEAPVVIIDRRLDFPRADHVLFEDEQAAYLATQILIAAGHTRIGFIGGLPGVDVERQRLNGYLSALRDKGLPPDPDIILEGDFSIPVAYRLSMHLLQMEIRPTAVITCNNTTSLGYFQASTGDNGLSAHTIEHIGFGELEMLDYLHFGYNHIDHDVSRLVDETMELLLSRLDNPGRQYETRVIPRRFTLNNRLSQIALRNGILTAGQIAEKKI